jgi:hypothetical protein
VQAYIAGAHNLQHLKRSCSALHHLISGAGAGANNAIPTPIIVHQTRTLSDGEPTSYLDANISRGDNTHVSGRQPCPRPEEAPTTMSTSKAVDSVATGASREYRGSESHHREETERGLVRRTAGVGDDKRVGVSGVVGNLVVGLLPAGMDFHALGPGFMAAQLGKGGLRVKFYGIAPSGGPQLLYSALIPDTDDGPSAGLTDGRARGWLRRAESILRRLSRAFGPVGEDRRRSRLAVVS